MKSPLFDEKGLSGIALQIKMMADLMRVHKKFNDGVTKLGEYAKEVHGHAQEVREHMARIQALPAGPRGKQGLPGDNTPIKGVHYFTESDKQELIKRISTSLPQPKNGRTPKKGEDYFTPEDIQKIADIVQAGLIIPSEEFITENVTKKIGSKKIRAEDIDGYENADSVLRRYIANGSRHGAGDTVTAGTNITITTNSDGKKIISASGGGFTFATPTGVVNGSNATFSVTQEPIYVIADGTNYFEGAGYSYSGLQIIMDVPPSEWIRYAKS